MKLRYKFFIFLVGLPSLALLIFLAMAFRVMVQDKTLYILESNMSLASSIAMQANQLDLSVVAESLQHLPLIKGSVFDVSGTILVSSEPRLRGLRMQQFLRPSTIQKLLNVSVDEGSFEDKNKVGEDIIFSFVKLPKKNAILLLMTPKSSAIRASFLFLLKAIVTFILLVSIAVGASWWLAKSMTNPIATLSVSMKKFADGDFTVSVPSSGNDEIGTLGRYFNTMVLQIRDLVKDREEKLKIDLEMSLASDLQRKILPEGHYVTEEIEFSGFYEPAGNCGGDWWFYFRKDNYFVVCIGDVTGHGVHSALLTTASRAILSGISRNFVGTSQAMGELNRGVTETTNGAINMTAIIAALDLNTGELSYTNASHENPYILPLKDGPLKKKDYQFLADVHGPRIGEDADYQYQHSIMNLQPRQQVFFYSDGVTDVRSPSEALLGERGVLNWLSEIHRVGHSAQESKNLFQRKISEFRRDRSIDDDVSYFFIKWGSHEKKI